ncbi:MAG: hypothetical protein HYY84_06475 [Deltaproteobacteria bacterium]|nr:hypothetical protein [Deltaproteobacteria bacterium]
MNTLRVRTRSAVFLATVSFFVAPSCATQSKSDEGVVECWVRLSEDFNVSLVRGLKLVIDSAPGQPPLNLTATSEQTITKGRLTFTTQVKNDDSDPENEFVVQFNTNVFGSRTFLFRFNGIWGADRPFALRAVVLLEGSNEAAATATATVEGASITLEHGARATVENSIACTPGISCIGTTAAPALAGTSPASPANNNLPRIRGQAVAAATIKVYGQPDCGGAVVGEGTGAELATDGIAVSVTDDSTTTFSAIATDATGNTSPCSSTTVTYIEDSTPPAAPSVNAATNPPSPGKSLTPRVSGSAEAGATIEIFKSATCEGVPAATGSAADFASGGIAISVANNATTTISVRAVDVAGNRSPCANPPHSYTADNASTVPALTATSPASPANSNVPRVRGSAESGAMVRLYKDSACAGGVADAGSGESLTGAIATGTAEDLAGAGIEVTVADDATTTFYAQATDALGNVSPCSAGLAYTEDSTPPAKPTPATVPASPSNNNEPIVKGTAIGADTVEVFTSACGLAAGGTLVVSGAATLFATTGLQVPPNVVPANATTTFLVRSKDAAQNASECATIDYVEDSTAPASPIGTGVTPAGPANKNDPLVQGTAEANASVRIYKNDATCTSAATTGSVGQTGAFAVTVSVDDNATTSFSAETVDRAGNISPCVQLGLSYVEDSSPATVTFAAASQTVNESAVSATVTVNLNTMIGTAIVIPFAVAGSAIYPADHSLANGTITIPAWSRSASLTFGIVNDALNEASETVVLTLSTPSNALLGAINEHEVKINDDDAVPTVAFSATNQEVSEAVGSVTVTATLSAVSGQAVTVPYKVSGSATNADHNLTDGSILIPAGQASGSVTFNVVDDALDEADETVVLKLDPPTNASFGATTTHTVKIIDNDDPPTVAFSAANQEVSEAVGSVTVTATLSAMSGQTVTVPYKVSGSATSADHNLTDGSITIPAGQLSATKTFAVVDDTLDEAEETVVLTLEPPTNATIASPAPTHTVKIIDNDDPPTLSFSETSQQVSESVGTVTVTAVLSAASGLDVSVPFNLSPAGTATRPADYYDVNPSTGLIAIPAGQMNATVTFKVFDDALDETDETVILRLESPTNATRAEPSSHTVTILDDDATPTVEFSLPDQTQLESIGTVTVTVNLSAASGKTVTVPFTVGGSATTDDYSNLNPASGQILFQPLQTTKTITFDVADDALDETNETVVFTLQPPTNAALGATQVHTVTINDNDATPTVTFTEADRTVDENVDAVSVTVEMSAASGQTVTVPFTMSGTVTTVDYTNLSPTNGEITFAPRETTKTITFNVFDDALDETNETIVFSLAPPTNANLGAKSAFTLTINDNDPQPTVGFSGVVQSVEESVGLVTIAVNLNAPSGLTVTVPYTVSASSTATAADYTDLTPTPQQISFAPGETSKNVTFRVVDDALNEENETIYLDLGTPTNATMAGLAQRRQIVIITDNDPLPTVEFTTTDQTVAESIGTVTVTATLSAPSGRTVTVPYTVAGTASGPAMLPADYNTLLPTSPQSLSFLPGETSRSITFNVVDDVRKEVDDTVILTLETPTNATLGAAITRTVTITDNDDPPTVRFTTATTSVTEPAGPGSLTVNVGVTLSAASDFEITVPYTVSAASTATSADHNLVDGVLPIPAGQGTGTITFNVIHDTLDEPNETVIIALGTPTNATAGTTLQTHTVTIADNDPTPTISFSAASQSVNASTGSVSVSVTAILSAESGRDVSATYTVTGTAKSVATATNPADHDLATPGTINIPAGQTSATVTFNVVDSDVVYEGSETVILTLDSSATTPTNSTRAAPYTHTVTIIDDDPVPTVEFTAASQTVAEPAGTSSLPVTFTVTLSGMSASNVTVPYTVSGTATRPSDHDLLSSSITIAAGTTTASKTVNIVNDFLPEPSETIIVTLSPPTGSPTGATLGAINVHTITVDDTTPSVAFSEAAQTAPEGATNLTVSVSIDIASTLAVNVPYFVAGTANKADHNLATGVFTIPAGELTTSASFNVTGDALYEVSKTIVLTLGTPTNAKLGATTEHTVTITDDPAPVRQASAGQNHTCATRTDNTLWCWGSNSSGQLGNGPIASQSAPMKISGTTWSTVAAGGGTSGSHTCATKSDGTLWCWGNNGWGQMGDGTFSSRNSPTQVAGTTWATVTAGDIHTCAIKADGSLHCWGAGAAVGIGTTTNQTNPSPVSGGGTWASVSAGQNQTCAIRSDNNSLWCWGENGSGQVGDGTASTRTVPTPILVGTTWASVSTGGTHSCAIRSDNNSLWCWGVNSSGQLGDGTFTLRNVPTNVLPGTTWVGVALGASRTCATRTDTTPNSLWCWGGNLNGQLGDGTTTNRTTPTQVTGTNWANAIKGGVGHTCATRTDNSLWCWGKNSDGQLGDGTSGTAQTTPRQLVQEAGTTWTAVANGGGYLGPGLHGCASRSDGTLWCWGLNTNGQLGDSSYGNRDNPTQVATPVAAGTTWPSVSVGNSHTCALRSDNTLWCWGLNSGGQLGDTTIIDRNTPTQVAGTIWASVSAGYLHTCATKTNNTLWCWGQSQYGRLGNGVNTASANSTPIQITADTNWASVSAGQNHTCARRTNNTVWCWGSNSFGSIGDGSNSQSTIPVQVPGTNWASVSAGHEFTCATRTNNTLWCWGFNSNGQLGDSTLAPRYSPTQVLGTAWESVSAGLFQTCATRLDDSLWCWGRNANGQLGVGTVAEETRPTHVEGANWGMVSAGSYHGCAVRLDGTLWCWGKGDSGQLGFRTDIRTTPVVVMN